MKIVVLTVQMERIHFQAAITSINVTRVLVDQLGQEVIDAKIVRQVAMSIVKQNVCNVLLVTFQLQ